MRAFLIVALALLAAGCSVGAGKGAPADGGYSVEIRANGGDRLYMISGPGGRAVAARAHDGVSALLNADDLQRALAAMQTPTAPVDPNNTVSISAPGFSLHVAGDGSDQADNKSADGHGRGDVAMNIGGFGMHVTADDAGPGDADDRAQVRLSGLGAADARRFITEADELSPAVRAQMLTALGLSQHEGR
jgi:hypothetical protein